MSSVADIAAVASCDDVVVLLKLMDGLLGAVVSVVPPDAIVKLHVSVVIEFAGLAKSDALSVTVTVPLRLVDGVYRTV